MLNKSRQCDPTNPLDEVSFICRPCKKNGVSEPGFVADPSRIEDVPEKTTHPWAYFADCPRCGKECKQQVWEIALMSSYGKHTGPKTEEGKANSKKNLEGYPTAEQRKRVRFNGLKHGMYAQTLEFFPARPGQYLQCKGCQIAHDVCRENIICAKEADRAMRYQIAFSENNPDQLRDIQANNQSRIQSIMDNVMLSLVNTGVELKNPRGTYDQKAGKFIPETYLDGDGEVHLSMDYSAHPLLKTLMDFVSKNSLTMADQGMTPKLREDEEELQGKLSGAEQKGDELLGYQRRQADALEGLKAMIENSKKRSDSDPILIEHGSQ
ncbi:MAG: hypothetical protein COB22_05935 [Cycloclasticus sp.]|nr:MAG: hypothetical protein COB22_05935 [Cycloclasticus sp.]